MKKQLLFCSLALASSMTAFAEVGEVVTDLTQLSSTKCYTITPLDNTRGTWCYYDATPNYLNSTTRSKAEIDNSDPNQQFVFIKSSTGYYYVYSVGAKKFLARKGAAANVGAGVTLVSTIDDATSRGAILSATNDDKDNNYPWVVAIDGHQLNLCNAASGGTYGVVFYDNLGDVGNGIKLTEAGDFAESADVIRQVEEAEAKAKKCDEANSYFKIPANSVGGYSEDLLNALNTACGGDGVADFADLENDGFDAAIDALKSATPIAFSNDKVYKLQGYVSGSGYLCFENGSDENSNYVYSSTKIEKQGLTQLENSANWQIYTVGDKFLLYNQGKQSFVKYDQGENKWVATDEPVYIDFKNFSTAVFGIQDLETLSGNSYININNGDGFPTGVLGYTCSQTTTGSHFYVIEVSDAEVTNLEELAQNALVNKAKKNIKLVVESYDESKANYVGSYSEESIAALQKAYDDPSATVSSLEEALANAKRKQVEAGKYYTILNTMPFTDGGVKAIYENPDGTNVAWHTTEGTAAELWQFEQEEGGDGDYYIKSSNTGKYIELMPGAGSGTVKETASTPFRFTEQGSNLVSFGLEAWNAANSDHATLVLQTGNGWGSVAKAENESGNYIGTYNDFGNAIPSKWNIVEVSSVNLTIGSTGYATAYFPFAVTIPEGVKAYTVSAAADGVATLSPLTGTIPANTGVILSGDAKTYPFAITTSTASAVEDNLLNGVTIATDLDPETSYILAKGVNGLGFYKVDPTDTKLAANKAYLNNANGSFFSLKLDGAVTGIQSVENAAENAPAYDLQGRRLPQVPTKGLYIQNGKKIMK